MTRVGQKDVVKVSLNLTQHQFDAMVKIGEKLGIKNQDVIALAILEFGKFVDERWEPYVCHSHIGQDGDKR